MCVQIVVDNNSDGAKWRW